MKQLYQRASITSSTDRVDATLRDAIDAHAEANQLGNVLADATTVCETRSVRRYRNGLIARMTGSHDPDREHRRVAVLTPRYLVIAVAGEPEAMPGLRADSGVSVVAHWSGETANQAMAAFYLRLGDDPAGRAFLASFGDAITSAKAR